MYNKEDNKVYMKKYMANAKDVECVCGSTVKSYRLYRHRQSNKHKKFVESNKMSTIEEKTKQLEQQLENVLSELNNLKELKDKSIDNIKKEDAKESKPRKRKSTVPKLQQRSSKSEPIKTQENQDL